MSLTVDVVGFYFLDLATTYQPTDGLSAFLAAGPPPVYIGYDRDFWLIVRIK